MRLIALLMLAITVQAMAGNDRGDGSITDVDVGVNTELNANPSTQVSSKGSTFKSLSLSAGDVDINQCRYSFQVVVIFQGTKENHWCEAESLFRLGFLEASVDMFCKKTSVKDLYPILAECREIMKPILASKSDTSTTPNEDKLEEVHEKYEHQIMAQQQELDSVKKQLDTVQSKVNKKPTSTHTVVKQEFLDDDKRAKLRQLLEK